jgi:hypothetical protein
MFKAKAARVAAFVLIMAGAAVFISCQDGTTAPTPVSETGKDSPDSVGISGDVRHGITNWPIPDVDVNWECETCDEFIGNDATDQFGRYNIDYTGVWSDHDDHNLKGYASKTGYYTATNTITNFQSANMPYERDFALYPE